MHLFNIDLPWLLEIARVVDFDIGPNVVRQFQSTGQGARVEQVQSLGYCFPSVDLTPRSRLSSEIESITFQTFELSLAHVSHFDTYPPDLLDLSLKLCRQAVQARLV